MSKPFENTTCAKCEQALTSGGMIGQKTGKIYCFKCVGDELSKQRLPNTIHG